MTNIKNLHKKARLLKKEIEQYQLNCNHKNSSIKTLENGDIRKVCDNCEKVLGYPSKSELDDWLSR